MTVTHDIGTNARKCLFRQHNANCTTIKTVVVRRKWGQRTISFGHVVEIDHIIPKKNGGSNTFMNLRLVHGHCHDQIHGKKLAKDMEEPDESKDSRPVLKGSVLE